MIDIPIEGYIAICEDKHGRYLCVPMEDAIQKNWMTKKARIYDSQSGKIADEMFFQAAFKWLQWFEIDDYLGKENR